MTSDRGLSTDSWVNLCPVNSHHAWLCPSQRPQCAGRGGWKPRGDQTGVRCGDDYCRLTAAKRTVSLATPVACAAAVARVDEDSCSRASSSSRTLRRARLCQQKMCQASWPGFRWLGVHSVCQQASSGSALAPASPAAASGPRAQRPASSPVSSPGRLSEPASR